MRDHPCRMERVSQMMRTYWQHARSVEMQSPFPAPIQFPVLPIKFPVSRKKFPVNSLREFARKLLISIPVFRAEQALGSENRKNSRLFPVSREFCDGKTHRRCARAATPNGAWGVLLTGVVAVRGSLYDPPQRVKEPPWFSWPNSTPILKQSKRR